MLYWLKRIKSAMPKRLNNLLLFVITNYLMMILYLDRNREDTRAAHIEGEEYSELCEEIDLCRLVNSSVCADPLHVGGDGGDTRVDGGRAVDR